AGPIRAGSARPHACFVRSNEEEMRRELDRHEDSRVLDTPFPRSTEAPRRMSERRILRVPVPSMPERRRSRTHTRTALFGVTSLALLGAAGCSESRTESRAE